MYTTRNSLPETTRAKLIPLLNERLADAVDLYAQIKTAHWNVKGPNFIAYHELFDKLAEETEEYVDELAERAVQLGGVAEGTVRIAASRSKLPEYPLNIADGRKHIDAIVAALATFGGAIRKAIDTATELGDADTADLFTEISRGADKALWFVEAHGQAAH